MSEFERQYKKFTDWYNEQLENKIELYMTKKEIIELIVKLKKYYENKYNFELLYKEFSSNEQTYHSNVFGILSEISKPLFEQELDLTPKESVFLNTKFRGATQKQIEENGYNKILYSVTIPTKYNLALGLKIHFDNSGSIDPKDIAKLTTIFKKNDVPVNLNQLYEKLKLNYSNTFDYEQLEQLVTGIELKQWFINLTLLSLANDYSFGCDRAKQFAIDFNQFYKTNIKINELKKLAFPPKDSPDDLRPLYNEYLDEYEKTGQRPHPSILLALRMLQLKTRCQIKASQRNMPNLLTKETFYYFYKDEIDYEINQIIKDFNFTREDMINYLEAAGHIYQEEYYEKDIAYKVFYKGWSALHWTMTNQPSSHIRDAYQAYRPYLQEKTKIKTKKYQ